MPYSGSGYVASDNSCLQGFMSPTLHHIIPKESETRTGQSRIISWSAMDSSLLVHFVVYNGIVLATTVCYYDNVEQRLFTTTTF